MKTVIPKEFLNVLTDIPKQRNFELIKSIIEKTWGYEIVTLPDRMTQRFYYGLFTLEYWEPMSVGFKEDEYTIDVSNIESIGGILTFDKVHNRFVIFQIVDKFTAFDGVEQMIQSVLTKDGNVGSWVIDDDIITRFSSYGINFELTKSIVLSFEIPTFELRSYLSIFHPSDGFGRGYELWKIDSLNEICYLEKVQNDFNEDIDYSGNKEGEFFYRYSLAPELVDRYNWFKEYLRFKFNCKLELRSEIDTDKLYTFIENVFNIEDIDSIYKGELDVSESYLQSFLENIIDDYRKLGLQHLGNLTVPDSFEYRFMRIDVITQGLDFNITFVIEFNLDMINVSMSHWDKTEDNIRQVFCDRYTLTKHSTYNDFDSFVNPVFGHFETDRTDKIEKRDKRNLERENQREKSPDTDLPF